MCPLVLVSSVNHQVGPWMPRETFELGRLGQVGPVGARAFTGHVRCGGVSRRMVQTT
jgi:hypothetical protein